jgi:uncharacterized protein DUF4339
MTNRNNDIEELEELLTELEGQEAQLVRPYSEDEDAVTQLMDAPLGDQEWMVQITALDRRMMSTGQLLSDLQAGKVTNKTLVWRGGMDDWMPVARVEELAQASRQAPAPRSTLGNLPPPPVAMPPQPGWSNAMNAPLGPPPVALPPPPNPTLGSSASNSGVGFQKPASLPPPPVARAPQLEQTTTSRPVAVDFSDMEVQTRPLQGKRTVMALSAVAILAVCVTAYALLSGGETQASAEGNATTPPRAVAALQPVAAPEKKPTPAPAAKVADSKPAASAPIAAAGESAAKDSTNDSLADNSANDSALGDNSGSPSGSSARQANAPARYSPRSEYRRRSRGGSAEEPSADNSSSREAARDNAPEARAVKPAAPSSVSDSPVQAESPTADDADAEQAPRSTSKSANTFNRDAAKSALDEAAGQAKNCRPQGGPSGTGRVQVRYEPSGKVAAVSILTSKFENTTAGSCIKMLFRRAKVPEFTGAPVMVVNKSFEIP